MAYYLGNPRSAPPTAALPEHNFELRLVQQPREGRTLPMNQRMKGHTWPVDPPPVLELISTEVDPEKWFFIHNPNWFCLAELVQVARSDSPQNRKKEESKQKTKKNDGGMSGSWSSSLHKVKGGPDESDRAEHGYFVFGDINIKTTGVYKLKFTLFEMRQHDSHVYATKVNHLTSDEFRVHSNKGETTASTRFSRLLSDAGVKVKLRAEVTKRKPPKIDWSSKQTDSMSRQLHLAPYHDVFTQSPASLPQGELRGRNNMGVDISNRVQTSHPPLATLVSPQMGSLSDHSSPTIGSHTQHFTSPTQQVHQPEWPPTMATSMHAMQPQYNPYARMSEHLQYPAAMQLQHGQPQVSMRPPSATVPEESGYVNAQSLWYQQQQQQQHHHQQQWYQQNQY